MPFVRYPERGGAEYLHQFIVRRQRHALQQCSKGGSALQVGGNSTCAGVVQGKCQGDRRSLDVSKSLFFSHDVQIIA